MRRQKSNYMRFALTYYLTVFIPLFIIIVGVLFVQTRQEGKRLETNIMEQCRRETAYWQDQMKVMNSYISECRYNKIYYLEYSDSTKLTKMEIVWDLQEKEAKFPFASGVYLVREDGGQVIASQGVYSNIDHAENLIYLEEQMRVSNNRGLCVYGTQVGQEEAQVIIFAPIEIGEHNTNRQYLTFVIPAENIRSQLGINTLAKQNATEIYYNDELVYSEDTISRETSRSTTYRCELGNGFWLVHRIPDIERMGNIFFYLRGFLLLAFIALLVGLYLAQRCSQKRYGTLQSIIASKESLENERESLENERNVLRKENCLYELVNRSVNPGDKLWHRCMSNDIRLDRNYKFFIFLPAECRDPAILRWIAACGDGSESATSAYSIRLHEQLTAYLMCSNEDKQELEKHIEFIRSSGEASVSSICEDVTKLRRTYREARRNYYHMTGHKQIYPADEMQAFQEAMELGDWEKSEILLDSLLDLLPEIDSRMLLPLMNEISAAVEANLNTVYDRLTGNVTIDLFEFRDAAKRQFREKVRRAMEAEKQKPEKPAAVETEEEEKTKRNVVDVLVYIQEHYLGDDFSIKQMAADFDTTPSNLSHFFKKQMDVSLAQYIEGLKMERAKELLKQKNMKIVEIAAQLGYRNSTAFIEVFKRREGMTPGAYRKTLTM